MGVDRAGILGDACSGELQGLLLGRLSDSEEERLTFSHDCKEGAIYTQCVGG